ncbi:MAG: sensor histidine kinase [Betaproteobacteria bacterium]|nr:sensor histidine kinase [Betaproteobacteria bacterium]
MSSGPETIPFSKEAIAAAQKKLSRDVDGEHFHPLEAISIFRRWPRSFARNFVYTLIFNTLFALAFLFMGVMFARIESASQVIAAFGRNLLISNVVGFSFWAVFALMGPVMRAINRQSFVVVSLSYATIGTVIVTLSFFAISFIPGYGNMNQWLFSPQQVTTSFIISLCISLVLATIWRRRLDELAAQMALAEERGRVEAAERAAVQANLRALQAQIEPHFLFNTLANVVGLIHPQPDTAKLMLEKFIAYLRASLAATREQETTLGNEFQLMANYLAILQIRMGDRLRVDVDLPADLAALHMPSMLLQPLLENAIKHGLEPKIEGGSVTLQARRDGEMLRITVSDTGLGFSDATSQGIGLRNVRERLAKLFDGKASIAIEENQPSGTRVILDLPYTTQTTNSSTGAASGVVLA